jgi:hypothetical protein
LRKYNKNLANLRRSALQTYERFGYKSYLKTGYWKWLRKQLLPHPCLLCGNDGQVLHHIEYRNIAYEKCHQIVPLCEFCHLNLHKTLDIEFPDLRSYDKARQTKHIWPSLNRGILLTDSIKKYKWKEKCHNITFKKKQKRKKPEFTKADMQPRCKKCDIYVPVGALKRGLCRHCIANGSLSRKDM